MPFTQTIARTMPPLKAGPLKRGLGSTSDMLWCCSTKGDAHILEFCMHFLESFAQKRDSTMACQYHAIAALERGVGGWPWERFAKDGPDCPGHKTLSFSVVERFPGNGLCPRFPETENPPPFVPSVLNGSFAILLLF